MKTHLHTNHLINESSPYLLQHAHNPVNWFPWGEQAIQKAKVEDKMLLISIGYAACHWCHVMENESFENEEVAEIMNKYFVCIKIDREERPDIDQIYMEAVQMMTGSGGWPLNCFALPDGRPFYGGTYFPTQHWKHILRSLANMYEIERQKIITSASELTNNIKLTESVEMKQVESKFTLFDLKEIVEPWKNYFDETEGGNNRAPKFPMPNSYEFLLEYSIYSKDEDVKDHVFNTLDRMAAGGIYDQAGGGFSRYSVDKYWLVPHFEKMLYDNAQLISLYSKAYRHNKKEEYKRIVYQTIDFVKRELSSKEGACYSSLDADSEGEEGKFYVWEKHEIDEVLGEDSALYSDYYQVSVEGNWEHGKNILHCKENIKDFSRNYHLTEIEFVTKIDLLNNKILKQREKRIRPGLDDKILCSWNALMLKAYVDAYKEFNEPLFLSQAIKSADFISSKMMEKDFRLNRNYKNGKASINAFLDDYAFTIEAFIALYQAGFDEKWLIPAQRISEYVLKHFYDKNSGMFYYTSDIDPELIARKMEINDNVIPASNSAMAKNMFQLGHYFYNDNYLQMAKQMLINVKDDMKKSGAYYSNWGILLNKFINSSYEIAICGKDAFEVRKSLEQQKVQYAVIAGSIENSDLPMLKDRYKEGKTAIYICKDRVCKMPVYGVDEALELMR
jgi:uncharacterized protein YyaL (SSP411 family)